MKLKFRCLWCRIKKFVHMCLKTKSSIFLLAYTLFLLYSLIMYNSWDDATSKRIIIAIIVAGAFFSIAELFYTLRELENRRYTYMQDLYAISIKAIKEQLEHIEELRAEHAELFAYSKGQNAIEVSVGEPVIIHEEQQREHAEEVVNKLNEEVSKMGDIRNKDSLIGNMAMIMGMLLFFILMTTDIATAYANIIADYLTIAAFAIVVITYYVKQLYFENTVDRIAEIRLKCLMGEKFE